MIDIEVKEGEDTLSDSFGISKERNQEIMEEMSEYVKKALSRNNVSLIITEIYNGYEDEVERMFAVFMFGSVIGSIR